MDKDLEVLVVEDDPLNRKLFCDLLEMADFRPIAVDNAVEGVRIARENIPSLILMDIQMAEIDGITALKELRMDEVTRNIKVIAVTARAMAGDEERFLDEGFDAYIPKPIDYKDFILKIKSLVSDVQ